MLSVLLVRIQSLIYMAIGHAKALELMYGTQL